MDYAELGDEVEIRYKGWKKSNGEIFEDIENPSQPPLRMTIGSKEFIPGLTRGIVGMQVGELRTLDIPKEEAYGKKRHELIQSVPRMSLLGKVEPKVGKILLLKNDMGMTFPAMITDILPESIILDMNPPLAGEDLMFKVKLERIIKKKQG